MWVVDYCINQKGNGIISRSLSFSVDAKESDNVMPLAYWTRNEQDIQYYDYLLGRYNSVDLNMLFLIGYSAATGHMHASDHIWIPKSLKDKNGEELITNRSFFIAAHEYLDEKWRIDSVEDGLTFDIWAFRFLLNELGFVEGKNGKIPDIMKSSDWNPMALKDSLQFVPPERKDGESDADYAMRYDNAYIDWNASRRQINYQARYQLAEGYLYGMSDMGYGTLPFVRRDISWYRGRDTGILQSAIDTIHNPVYRGREDLQGRNLFYNMENADPYNPTDATGNLQQSNGDLWQEPTDSSSTLTGHLFGEVDLPSFPDMWRYAEIFVRDGIEVQMTFWMMVGRMIPNVFVSTIIEASDNLYDTGTYNIKAHTDVRRAPLSVIDVHLNNRDRVRFPIGADVSMEYTLPDVYLESNLGTYDRTHLIQGIENDAFVVAQQTQMINSSEISPVPSKPESAVGVYYSMDLKFKECGVTLPGQGCMYGLNAKGIRDVLYVRAVPDACFTHSEIERLSEEEINQMHFLPVVGNIVSVTNQYDSDRPNLVISVSFDFSESSGFVNIASLVFYASRNEDGVVIPFALMSIGNSQVSMIDVTNMREMTMTLTLKDI